MVVHISDMLHLSVHQKHNKDQPYVDAGLAFSYVSGAGSWRDIHQQNALSTQFDNLDCHLRAHLVDQ